MRGTHAVTQRLVPRGSNRTRGSRIATTIEDGETPVTATGSATVTVTS